MTRQYTRNRELGAKPMSSSSSAAVAIAPEYVMESIVDHGYAEDGELLYRIRWYGYAAVPGHLGAGEAYTAKPHRALQPITGDPVAFSHQRGDGRLRAILYSSFDVKLVTSQQEQDTVQ